MPNPSTEATPRGVSGVAGFISVLIFSIINFFLFGKGVILDPFHQGEYFATLPTLLHSQPGAHAFTIHGGLDSSRCGWRRPGSAPSTPSW